jgi:hypothetical protein
VVASDARPHLQTRQRPAYHLARQLCRGPRWDDLGAVRRCKHGRTLGIALRVLSGPQSGEQRYGRAASFEAARAEFEAAWREYLPKRSEADFEEWRHRAAPASGGVGIEVAPRKTGIWDASLGGLPS